MSNYELETYLMSLEKKLEQVSVGDRAEIITEIKSHVLDASESGKSVSEILDALGTPQQVANRYLLERGLEPKTNKRGPILKWLTIAFLGTFSIAVIGVLIIVWKFTPIIKVDEEKGRVQILGGLLDIKEGQNNIRIGRGNFTFDSNSTSSGVSQISGVEDFVEGDVKNIAIKFSNGQVSVKNTKGSSFSYSCEIKEGLKVHPSPKITSGLLQFDLEESRGVDCNFEVPKNVNFDLKGLNGEVSLLELENHVSTKIINGEIGFSPAANIKYSVEALIQNGSAGTFEKSNEASAYKIKLEATNGNILKL